MVVYYSVRNLILCYFLIALSLIQASLSSSWMIIPVFHSIFMVSISATSVYINYCQKLLMSESFFADVIVEESFERRRLKFLVDYFRSLMMY